MCPNLDSRASESLLDFLELISSSPLLYVSRETTENGSTLMIESSLAGKLTNGGKREKLDLRGRHTTSLAPRSNNLSCSCSLSTLPVLVNTLFFELSTIFLNARFTLLPTLLFFPQLADSWNYEKVM